VKGIGLVNLVHTKWFEGDFYPFKYRVYNPDEDDKTKHDHFREMFVQANEQQQIKARNIAFDSWYAIVDNLKFVDRSGWTFYRATEKQPQSKFIKRNWLSGFIGD
jgi:hypothetical protein